MPEYQRANESLYGFSNILPVKKLQNFHLCEFFASTYISVFGEI